MRTKLAIIALSGFALSAACLGGAYALGAGHGRHIAFDGFGWSRCDFEPSGQSATRQLAWDGSDSAGVAVPASVHYHRGQGDQLVVTGDGALVSHVQLVDGDVRFDCGMSNIKSARLDVTLPGRDFRSFSLAGTGDMTLDGIDQSDLKISLAGAGNIAASGKVGTVKLSVAGSGDAKLGALAADRVALSIAGSSNVDVAPKDDLKVSIAGSGTVMLHTEPHSLETSIIGSGRIIRPDGAVEKNKHADTGLGMIPG